MQDSVSNIIPAAEPVPIPAQEQSQTATTPTAPRPVRRDSEVRNNTADTLRLSPIDEVPADSIKAAVPGISIPPQPTGVPVQSYPDTPATTPWLVTIMLLLFVLLSVRYRNNFRFLRAMISDLVNVRHRNNMFDETVRETSFLITLDILCIAEVSILAQMALLHYLPITGALSLTHTLLICMGCVGGLYLLQWMAYNAAGYIFSDSHSRKMWVHSFGTSQGLLGIVLFPVTLAAIFNPTAAGWLLWVGGGCFAAARILFIYKGFRIFFSQIGSWVLFLYYLCSLEVIPIILTAVGICALCGQ